MHCTLATPFCVTNHPLQWPRGLSLLLQLTWFGAAFSTSKRNVVTNVRLLPENRLEHRRRRNGDVRKRKPLNHHDSRRLKYRQECCSCDPRAALSRPSLPCLALAFAEGEQRIERRGSMRSFARGILSRPRTRSARVLVARTWSSAGEDRDDVRPPSSQRRNVPFARRGTKKEQAERARMSAVRSLAYRMHTRLELRQKLASKGFDEEAVEAAMAHVIELGYQDDVTYAEAFTRHKWRTGKWSPSRIQTALQQKGLIENDAHMGVTSVFQEGKLRADEHLEDLVRTAKKRVEFNRDVDRQSQRRRLVAWLQRRGHDWNTVASVLRAVDLY